VITQNDVITWRASQDEQMAKIHSALRIAKGRNVGDKGKNSLKTLLREFVDRARIRST
jgi:hypothetical protein